jgi:uncharacterized protein (DUF2336 family)
MMDFHTKNLPNIAATLARDFSERDAAERSRIIRDVAALFIDNCDSLSPDQVGLFDDVLLRLVEQIDRELRVYMAEHLAPIKNAPTKVLTNLAQDGDIAVAGPVLQQAEALDEDFLIERARTQGQQHLKAISLRKRVGPRLGDALTDRGDTQVMLTLASNAGATLTERSYALIIERAKDNMELASVLWNRPDISRQHVITLFERASAAVREAMERESGKLSPEVTAAIDLAKRKLQDKTLDSSAAYANARANIAQLENNGGLTEMNIRYFAQHGQFEELVVALSTLSRISAGDIERMLQEESSVRLLIVLKGISLSWFTVRQILLATRTTPVTVEQLEQTRSSYQLLSPEAATKLLKYHWLREKARGGAAYTDHAGRFH